MSAAKKGERFVIDKASFWAIVSMLVSNRFKVDFREKKRKSWGRIVLFFVAFALISALFYLFYFLTGKLTIFSALQFVPLTVPSLIASAVFIFGFLSLCPGLTKDLYFSKDNQVLLTYPTNGSTLLMARVFAYSVYEYVKNIFLLIPIFVGYAFACHYALWVILWLFPSVLVLTIAELGIASLVSIPLNAFFSFTKKHSVSRFLTYLFLYAALIALAAWFVSIVPDHIDVFTNWGTIFFKIQSFLNGYARTIPAFYWLSQGVCGYSQNGTKAMMFYGNGVATLFILLAIGVGAAILSAFAVNPLFLKFASNSFEDGNALFRSRRHSFSHSPFASAFKKEIIGFFRDPSRFMPFFGSCVFIALLTIVLNRFYSAFNSNTLGAILIEVTEFLVLSLLMLNTSSFLTPLYGHEDGALSLEVSYPLQSALLLYSKAFLPSLVGDAAIIVSVVFFGYDAGVGAGSTLCLALAALFLYNGHVLFSITKASGGHSKGLSSQSQSMRGEILITLAAFLLPIVFSILFYLYLKDGFSAGPIKLMVLCFLYFVVSLYGYLRYAKYLFGEGEA
jgi:hypothetical protein